MTKSAEHTLLKAVLSTLIAVSIVFVATLIALNTEAAEAETRPLVGVIRYDAFSSEGSSDTYREQRYLGPKKYENQLPFYAVKPTEDTVVFNNATQAIIDQEILWSYEAGIDYWAHVYASPYRIDTDMAKIYQLHQTSRYKNLVKISFIIYPGHNSDQDIENMIDIMCRPEYQKTPDGKVLVYTFISNQENDKDLRELQMLKEGLWAAKRLEMCIITMGWDRDIAKVTDAKRWQTYGGAGATMYIGPGEHDADIPFAELDTRIRERWDNHIGKGNNWQTVFGSEPLQSIPLVCTGVDSYSRFDSERNPFSWDISLGGTNAKPSSISPAATKTQLQNQLKDALKWVRDNPENTSPDMVIMYSWNEFSEGGAMSICPKYDKNHPGVGYSTDHLECYDRTVLDWIKEVLTDSKYGGSPRTLPDKGSQIPKKESSGVTATKAANFNGGENNAGNGENTGNGGNYAENGSYSSGGASDSGENNSENGEKIENSSGAASKSGESNKAGGTGVSKPGEDGISPVVILLIIAAAVLLVGGALLVVLKFKKGKEGA